MSKLRKVNLSKNYDTIINFLYEENNEISKFLIECYQEYIFNIKNKKSISNIDNIMNEYVKKNGFYRFVNNYFKTDNKYNSFDKIILQLNKLYKEYEEDKIKNIKNTRWL